MNAVHQISGFVPQSYYTAFLIVHENIFSFYSFGEIYAKMRNLLSCTLRCNDVVELATCSQCA